MRTQQATTIKLPSRTKERIQALAGARKRSAHSLMLEALEGYIEREEKREAWRQEGLRAYNEYMATGLHVTGEEADAWLARLEAGENAGAPECHL
jgi:predicted transcriptional regulator